MKAWQVEGAFGLDNLRLVDVDDPKAPPGHVVVRVKAASLNYRDLMMVRGEYNPKQPLPLIPCSDGAGDVVDVGAGCTEPAAKIGARVATLFAQGWLGGPATSAKIKRTLGGPLPGALASHIVLAEHGIAPIPDAWSFAEAATLPCAALTAWSGVVEQANIKPGQRLLTLGTGGVSLFALQFAKRAGARTAVVTAKPGRVPPGLADEIIERTSPSGAVDWEKRVRALWPDGADVVVEVGGAGSMSKSIRACAAGGTVLVIGVLANNPGDGAARAPDVNLVPVLMQNIRMQGVFVGSRDSFVAMTRALVDGGPTSKPIIDKVFPFADARDAFDHLASANHIGKIIVDGAP